MVQIFVWKKEKGKDSLEQRLVDGNTPPRNKASIGGKQKTDPSGTCSL